MLTAKTVEYLQRVLTDRLLDGTATPEDVAALADLDVCYGPYFPPSEHVLETPPET